MGDGLISNTPNVPEPGDGTGNTAVGVGALNLNASGWGNTAVGNQALQQNTVGRRNSAFGVAALRNSDENANSAFGYEALMSNTSGVGNTGIGYQTLTQTTTGSNNLALGSEALRANSTGSLNIGIGAGAEVGSGDLTNAIAIGSAATVDASNKIQLGNSSITAVATSGMLTTGSVTYPNTDGTAGQVLATDGAGIVGWVDDSDTLGELTGCSEGNVPRWSGTAWECSTNTYAARSEELEERVASLQKQLQDQKDKAEGLREELLAVVQSQHEQMAAQQVQMATQQEQIAQLQRMVEQQFAAR